MTPILELIRLEEGGPGTLGILKVNKSVFCYTLEPNDRENQRSRSSIPAQQYVVAPYQSQRYGETWMVQDVPDRDYILFHPGNVEGDTEGCILLGDKIGKLKGMRAVLNSGATFRGFLDIARPHAFLHLTIREVY